MIKTEKLTKYYNKHRGIIDVDLSIKKGEIFGFIGPNGAGKSTTIRILLNMIFKTEGDASIFNLDVEKKSKEIKQEVGYVPAEVNYYDFMKVTDILNFTKSFDSDVTDKKIKEICSFLDLDMKRYIRELSSGNKKKVAIAQAILRDPKLLILDEPTNGLDPLMQKKLFDLLIDFKKKGKTVFLSSHNLNEVEKYCDRVGFIKDGKMLSVQTIDEIKSKLNKKVIITYKDKTKKEFIHKGKIKELIKELSDKNIIDLEIKNTSLEEGFLDIYGSGE